MLCMQLLDALLPTSPVVFNLSMFIALFSLRAVTETT